MSGEWLAMGAVAALAAAGAVRGSANERPSDKVLTRPGFPWPRGTVLYHGTAHGHAIERQGFKTRKQGAPSMTGGGHEQSVSTTLLPQRAAAIALGLDTMARVAKRDLSLSDLVYALDDECPRSTVTAVTELADWVRSLGEGPPPSDSRERMYQIMSSLDLLDKGWTYVYLWGADTLVVAPYEPPRGSIYLGGSSWLVPPGSPLPTTMRQIKQQAARRRLSHPQAMQWAKGRSQGAHHGRCDAAYRIYKSVLDMAGMSAREAFNPNFIGTDVGALEKVPLHAIGMLELTVDIPHVCADQRGAVRLGYLTHEDPALRDTLATLYSNCNRVLEGDRYGSGDPANEPLVDSWFSGARDPRRWEGWTLEQTGTRTPDTTMLYYDGEEEVRIFAPRRIHIERLVSVSELRQRYALGSRLTFPWFDPKTVNIQIWPTR
jgi:hypothetical protein